MEAAAVEQGELPAEVGADDGLDANRGGSGCDGDGDAGQAVVVPRVAVDEAGAAVNSIVERRRKLRYEYSKRTLPLEFMVLAAHCARSSSTSYADGSVAFKISLLLLFVAFLADVLSVAQLFNSVSLLPPPVTVCLSGFSLVLMVYFLLVSLGRIYAYAILAVPLSLAAAFIGHALRVGYAGEDGGDNEALDHIFHVSSGVVTIIVGGGLTGTIFGHSISSVQTTTGGAAGALGFLLFFTTVVGLHVMLITTVRTPALSVHAKHLLSLLLLLLVTSTLVAAAESAGALAFVAFFLDSIEAVSLAVSSAAVQNGGDGKAARRKENQLLSTVVAAIIFTRIMQIHAAASDSAAEAVRMLLYFKGFLCSLNWRPAGLDDAPARVVVRRALVWERSTVLVLTMLDMFYQLIGARVLL